MNIASDVAYGAYEITTLKTLFHSFILHSSIALLKSRIGVEISYTTPATNITSDKTMRGNTTI